MLTVFPSLFLLPDCGHCYNLLSCRILHLSMHSYVFLVLVCGLIGSLWHCVVMSTFVCGYPCVGKEFPQLLYHLTVQRSLVLLCSHYYSFVGFLSLLLDEKSLFLCLLLHSYHQQPFLYHALVLFHIVLVG